MGIFTYLLTLYRPNYKLINEQNKKWIDNEKNHYVFYFHSRLSDPSLTVNEHQHHYSLNSQCFGPQTFIRWSSYQFIWTLPDKGLIQVMSSGLFSCDLFQIFWTSSWGNVWEYNYSIIATLKSITEEDPPGLEIWLIVCRNFSHAILFTGLACEFLIQVFFPPTPASLHTPYPNRKQKAQKHPSNLFLCYIVIE